MIDNSILWDNVATTRGDNITVNDAEIEIEASLVGVPSGDDGIPGSWSSRSNNIVGLDPLWKEGSFQLQPESPARDAGKNHLLPSDIKDFDGDGNISESLSRDLQGMPRVLGNTLIVDMGAYEYIPPVGDINGDFLIDDKDLNLILSSLGTANTAMDYDGSGTIDGEDLLVMQYNFGRFVPPETGDVKGDFMVNEADLNLLLSAMGSDNVAADLNRSGLVDKIDLDALLYYFGSDFTPENLAQPVYVPIGPIQQGVDIVDATALHPAITENTSSLSSRTVPPKPFTRRGDQNPVMQRARLHDRAFLIATQAEQRTFWWNETDHRRKQKACWSDEVDMLFQNEKPDEFFPAL